MRSPASDAVQRDRAALVALYEATDGANWDDSTNWLSDAPLSEWHGVTTDTDGRVMELSLAGNKLTGSLPAELGYLTNLQVLELAGNSLDGALPAAWGRLGSLEVLELAGNHLSGPLPTEWHYLRRLDVLDLSRNSLSGVLPAEWGQLDNLGC